MSAGPPALAQSGDEYAGRVWQIDELFPSFCVQFLIDPAHLAFKLPEGVRLLPAGSAPGLHPSLRQVVQSQPEFAVWAPSRLCLLYFGYLEADGRRIRQQQLRKAPMLGVWTVAVEGGSAEAPGELVLEMFTNNGGVEGRARQAGLSLRSARTTVGPAPEDEEGRPSPNDRYTLRLDKTQITWEGRPAGDSTAMAEPLSFRWRSEGRRGGWVDGTLSLAARTTSGMIGALKVQGKGDLMASLVQSPIRFVGPGYRGGSGELRIGR